MQKLTSEEIVTILTCFEKNRREIESLRGNPFVGADLHKMMDRDLVVMANIQKKLHTVTCGA